MNPLMNKFNGKLMGQNSTENRPYLPKRHKRAIKLDRVDPRDWAKMNCRFFCEDCSHFSSTNQTCTIGYVPQHTRTQQMKIFELTGKMAFCRFLEID